MIIEHMYGKCFIVPGHVIAIDLVSKEREEWDSKDSKEKSALHHEIEISLDSGSTLYLSFPTNEDAKKIFNAMVGAS